MNETIELYKNHVVAEGKKIVAGRLLDIDIISDRSLLGRVLGNMVKNALEADPAGSTITISCFPGDQKVVFSVHNTTFMPQHVQLQIFNRSFSSKGKGRGLGTYSMKLLSERYSKQDCFVRISKGTRYHFLRPIPAPNRGNRDSSTQSTRVSQVSQKILLAHEQTLLNFNRFKFLKC
ncbi:MAG: ATP-binding protein [Ignavibacteriales bacterium]|nr:ATP-binding protein [Ignavibacteriales bacterium]